MSKFCASPERFLTIHDCLIDALRAEHRAESKQVQDSLAGGISDLYSPSFHANGANL